MMLRPFSLAMVLKAFLGIRLRKTMSYLHGPRLHRLSRVARFCCFSALERPCVRLQTRLCRVGSSNDPHNPGRCAHFADFGG